MRSTKARGRVASSRHPAPVEERAGEAVQLEPLRPDQLDIVRGDLVVEQVLQDEAGRDVARAQERGEQHRLLLAEPWPRSSVSVAHQSSRPSTSGAMS